MMTPDQLIAAAEAAIGQANINAAPLIAAEAYALIAIAQLLNERLPIP